MSEESSSFVAPAGLLERVRNINQIYKQTVKLYADLLIFAANSFTSIFVVFLKIFITYFFELGDIYL